jgi:alpha-amylase
VLYFQVHQPKRLSNLRFFDIGAGSTFFDDDLNGEIVQRIARECYLPANRLLLKLINRHPEIKVAFSLSGVIIDQLEEFAPEVLDSFRALASTGSVEFLSETYYHSLACMMPGKEFESQVAKHSEKMHELFGVRPSVFRNTELIYNDDIGRRISKFGFKGVVADGLERILGLRSANHVFSHPGSELKILLRNYRLSDDIAFRFREDGKTLTTEKYLSWLNALPGNEQVVTLALDYETFGEHQKKDTGIFQFLETLLVSVARSKNLKMVTPTEAIEEIDSDSILDVPQFISWADNERDLSAWLGNDMQRDAFDSMLKLEYEVKNLNDENILDQWRNLQTSDHFYYMCTKKGSDGVVHNYFSPYQSPYQAFINFMNILTDFSMKLQVLNAGKSLSKIPYHLVSTRDETPQSVGSRMTMLSTH